jgi:PHD/YefM family antitoxin component YafN of YafNO toxin-antitoxin module
MSQSEEKTIDLKSLVDATLHGPAMIQRTGHPNLVVMREDTYADLLDKVQTVRTGSGDDLFSDTVSADS